MKKILAAFVTTLLILLLGLLPIFDNIEQHFFDLLFKIRGAEPSHPDIVIIEIDDMSLAAIGSWPWPRSYHGVLLKILSDYKPSVIFYDVIFPETSSEDEDVAFAQGLEKAGNVILPFYFASSRAEKFYEDPAIMPIPLLKDRAEELAFINNFRDRDGHARYLFLTAPKDRETFLHASLAAVKHHKNLGTEDLKYFPPLERFRINFPGPYETFKRIPFIEIISSQDDPAARERLKTLQGKIVLVGLTATGTTDLLPVVFSPTYPGIGLQASMIHTLLTEKFIRTLQLPVHALLLFLFSLLVLILTSGLNPLRALFYTAASLLILFEGAVLVFQHTQILVPYLGFLLAGFAIFIANELRLFVKTLFQTELMSRELALAAKIQKSFLPAGIPKIEGLEIAVVSLPAKQVGGDLYDILPLPDGKWGICVGDVSGKGIPAALFMAKAISEFRREARNAPETSVPLQKLNSKIAEEGAGGLFLTLLYLIADPVKKSFSFSSGGHEPVFYYRKETGKAEILTSSEGTPLGVVPDGNFDRKEFSGQKGDVLLLISDGVKEAMNSRREIFGNKRIFSALLESAGNSAQAIIDHLLEKTGDFVKNAPQHDDLTAVCIKFI